MLEHRGGVPAVPGVTVGRELGHGRTSRVYAGIDAATGHPVAVKVIEAGVDETRSQPTGFSVGHTNLLRLFRIGRVSDGRTCLVMEHCAGGSLGALTKQRPRLDVGEVVTVLAGVAAGTAALHEAGYVHGDLSPANVLFTDAGQPVLGDLDVVRRTGEPRGELGTSGFADLTTEDAHAAPSEDVFALGALAWYCLTGAAPVPGSLTPLTAQRDDVPAALADLVVTCLGPAPKRPTAAAVAQAVAALDVPPERVRLSGTANAQSAADPGVSITTRLRAPAPAPSPISAKRTATAPGTARPSRPTRRRREPGLNPWPRRAVPAVLGLVMVLAVGQRLLGSGSGDAWAAGSTASVHPSATASATATASGTASSTREASGPVVTPSTDDAVRGSDPVPALIALNEQRTQAISAADADRLPLLDAPGSPALAHDLDLVRRLSEAGVELHGLEVKVLWTTVRAQDESSARILLSSVAGAHRQVRVSDGSLVAQVPAAKVTTVEVALVRRDGQWFVQEVRPGA